jgi:hypothetical protein
VVVEWLLNGVVQQEGGNTFLVPDAIGSTVSVRETATGTGTVKTSQYDEVIAPGIAGTKHVSNSRRKSGEAPGQQRIVFDTSNVDDWGTGFPGDFTYAVPNDGTYRITANVNWPDTSNVGWGNGWSGSGSATAWIRIRRAGAIINDSFIFSGGWVGTGGGDFYNYCGPGDIALLAGDTIEFIGDAGATGLDCNQWEATLIMEQIA